MIRIKTDLVITRNKQTGKKQYTDVKKRKILNHPILPSWKKLTKSTATDSSESYVIKPQDDLIVVDCDSIETTAIIDQTLSKKTYTVISDQSMKHFYFTPTEYFSKSPIKSSSRVSANKIDILQGECIVFTPCEANHTKHVYHDLPILPIPDKLVDILVNRYTKNILDQTPDFEPNDSFRAPIIDVALAQWHRAKDYSTSLQSLFEAITPKRYRAMVMPDYHPDSIPDGEGINYLQALSTKIARDQSISPKLHTEILSIIAFELWSEPLEEDKFKAFMSNQFTQTINGKTVFCYNPDYSSKPLVSVSNRPYRALCRDANDAYYTTTKAGDIISFKSFVMMSKTMRSKNYNLMIGGKTIAVPKEDQLLPIIDTVAIVNTRRLPSGRNVLGEKDVFNTYQHSRYISIIRGDEGPEIPSDPMSFPTIEYILRNLTADLEYQDETLSKFYQFLSHKFKTFDYSPLVFQMLGIKGIGKNTFVESVLGAIDKIAKSNINSSNNQFNSEFAESAFIFHDEDIISKTTMNFIKKVSGGQTMRIEAKAVNATSDTYNSSTFICTANSTTAMKEGIDDRRVVMFSGFEGVRLNIPYLDAKIAAELEPFCRFLRDIEIADIAIYNDANAWRDPVTDIMVEDRSEQDSVIVKATNLMVGIEDNTISLDDIIPLIKDITNYYRLGYNNILCIPLASKHIINKTQEYIDTKLDRVEAKENGLARYVKRDTNKKYYSGAIYELRVTCPHEIYEFLKEQEQEDSVDAEPIDLEDEDNES